MSFPHPNDSQDESINASDDEAYEGNDSKKIGTVRIGNGAEGRLIPIMIPSHNHKAEMQDGTSDENGEGLVEGQRNDHLEGFRKEAMANLTSPEGKELRKRRNVEVESVFGQIKRNMGYDRFKMRGLEKVNVELGLIAISHNLKKMFNIENLRLKMS